MKRETIQKHLESQGKSANTPVTFADLAQLADAGSQEGTAAGQGGAQDATNQGGQGSGQGQGGNGGQGGQGGQS